MKPFCNKGWRWLYHMQKIIPITCATGAHSFAAAKADPPSLAGDEDKESDDNVGPLHTPANDAMDVDGPTSASASTAISTATTISTAIPATISTAIPVSTTNLTTISTANISSELTTKQKCIDANSVATALPSQSGSLAILSVPPTKYSKKLKSSTSEKIKGKGKARPVPLPTLHC